MYAVFEEWSLCFVSVSVEILLHPKQHNMTAKMIYYLENYLFFRLLQTIFQELDTSTVVRQNVLVSVYFDKSLVKEAA